MKKQLINEVSRINEIMGTKEPLLEQATITKWLKLLFGVSGDVAKLTFKQIVEKIPELSDRFIVQFMRTKGAFTDSVFKSTKGEVAKLNAAKKAITEGFNKFLSGKIISETTANLMVKLAMESEEVYKILSKELVSKAEVFGMKMSDILSSNEIRIEFQKLLSNANFGLNLKNGIPDSLLSRMADDFITAGGKLKVIITDGWWKKLWSTVDDVDIARLHAIDAVFNKFLTNKTYFNVKGFITKLVDPAIFKTLAAGTNYKTLGEFADAITEALSKGQELGRLELELLQKLMINNNKHRALIYENLAQSSYIKQYVRDIPVRVLEDGLEIKDVDKFFEKVIGSTDPNDMVLFKRKLGFQWDLFKAQTWKNLVSPITWKYTFLKAKDMFFSPSRYPRFFQYYWYAFAGSSLMNWLYTTWVVSNGIIPNGQTKSEAGTTTEFFLKLKGAKTLILDEGGLDEKQAKTTAKMIYNLLNSLFEMEDNLPSLFKSFRLSDGEDGIDEDIKSKIKAEYGDWDGDEYDGDDFVVSHIHNHRDLFKKFTDWVQKGGKTDSGWDIGVMTYLTGVSDSGIQSIYTNLIPTVLASSQVTYQYEKITGKKGSLLKDLMRVEPIFFVIPIPLISRTFTEGIDEIFAIIDGKQWMNSVTDSEASLPNILESAIENWPTFPESLLDKNGVKLWCKWSGHIPPDALVTIMDGTDDATGALPPYEIGKDQQGWLKNLSVEEFNRSFNLSVVGDKNNPYGWTDLELAAVDNKVEESKASISSHIGEWVSQMENFKELILQDPDRICNLAPKLCELIKITKEAHNNKVTNNQIK